MDELDAVLDQADSLIRTDYSAAMEMLGNVTVDLPLPFEMDPFSPDYADWVMRTYHRIAAVDAYEPKEHEADRNVETDLSLSHYFPYVTQDLGLIGRYIAGVGMILAELGLPPVSRIVEYGVGWGHVAAALARAGHDVTVVDIEPKFLRLAERQAEALGCHITTHHGAFGDRSFPVGARPADGVIFFEAFHHAFAHRAVLRQLRKDVLRPGGVLVLAAEPVNASFPVPWGVRPDGHALWAVRRHKWMELGFQEDYLLRAMIREGFVVSRTLIEALGSFGLLYRGQLHEGAVQTRGILLPAPEMASWAPQPPQGEPYLWAQLDSRATLDQDPSWSRITVRLGNPLPVPLGVAIDAGGAGPAARRIIAPGELVDQSLPLPRSGRELRVWSETAVPASLGINDDMRPLGVAVHGWSYHDL
jgi:SAM-dependent methyltransferase